MGLGKWIAVLIPAFWAIVSLAGENRRFSQIDLEDGLSHRTIYTILQDSQGYMWFGSQNGLNRYDGIRVQVYHKRAGNPNSLTDDNISSILEDEAGNLWLGTWGGGINCFHPRNEVTESWRFKAEDPNSLSSDYIQCLVKGRNGLLWIGTLDGGLCQFDRKTGMVTRYGLNPNEPNAPTHRRVWSVYEQEDGLVWVGTETGLRLLDPRRNRFLPVDLHQNNVDLSQISTRVLYAADSESLWVGLSMGLVRMDLKTREVVTFPTAAGWGKGLDKLLINALLQDEKGNLLIGTLYDGIKYLDTHTGQVENWIFDPRDPFSLCGNDVRSLCLDQSNNLWVGTRGSGLSKLDMKHQKFQTYRHIPGETNSLPFGDIRSLALDPKGPLWVGTLSSGLTRMDREHQTYQHFKNDPADPHSLAHNNVTGLAFDQSRRLLVGTFGGLNRLEENGHFTHFLPAPNDDSTLPHERVLSLLTDSQNRTWVGTHVGVSLFDGSRFKNYAFDPQKEHSLGKGQVLTLYEDRRGRIWLGLDPMGLYRYRPESDDFEAYHNLAKAPSALADNEVLTLFDNNDALWIGTMGGGLISMRDDGASFGIFEPQGDQAFNTVFGILPGDFGSLWMSTNKGLGHLDTKTQEFRLYGIFDGVQSTQFSMGAFCRSGEGELFFGGIEGINAFQESDVQDHYYIPRVVLSSLKIDGVELRRDLTHNSEVVTNPPRQGVSFEFAALDYTRPSKNMFQYRLKGIDKDWSPLSTTTFANYPALTPGTYTFQVKGSNHDGAWNPNPTEIELTVASSFFETWFYYLSFLSGFLVLLVCFGSFLRYRQVNQVKISALERSERHAVEANRSKSTFLAHLSHELRTPLNAIIGFTELIEEDLTDYNPEHFRPKQCKEDLAKIKSSAYLQLAQVNNLLELTRLESGKSELYLETFEVLTMVKAVLHHIEPMLHKTANRLEVRFEPEDIGEMTADFMKVQGILINLLSNANKFTRNGLISLSVMRTLDLGGNQICFKVTDTGCGIQANQLPYLFDGFSVAHRGQERSESQVNGLGLYLSHQFIKMMGGEIEVQSQISKGTSFSVILPTIVRV